MDITAAATQLMSALGNNPDMLSQFANHPYSTTAQVTGTNETISQKDMSRIIAQLAGQATGQNLGASDTKDLAAALMSQSGGSVHNLASMLFGGAAAQPAAATTSASAKKTGTKKKRATSSSASQTAAAPTATAANLGGFDLGGLLGALSGGSSNAGNAGTPSMAEIVAKSLAGGLAARGMAGLITHAMGTNKKN